MTEAQIEAIARLYCAKLGLDPGPELDPSSIKAPTALRIAMEQVRGYFAMQEAIAEVRATVTEGGV